jgi:hypothetical protein
LLLENVFFQFGDLRIWRSGDLAIWNEILKWLTFFFPCPIMLLAIGATLTALVASLTVTNRGKEKNEKSTASTVVHSIKQSPKKKNLGEIRIKQEDVSSKSNKLDYHFKIMKLKPDFEVIWIDATPGNDAYAQDLFRHITDENGFREFGLLLVTRRRISQADNNELKNARNNYARRCIVRALDGVSTHDSRLAILRAFQLFLCRPEFNKYGYNYAVDHESDLTPEDPANFVAMDHFIHNDVIVNIMVKVYEETDAGWYNINREAALDFFSGPLFPAYAIEKLGYPSSAPNNPGCAAGFNLPDANES